MKKQTGVEQTGVELVAMELAALAALAAMELAAKEPSPNPTPGPQRVGSTMMRRNTPNSTLQEVQRQEDGSLLPGQRSGSERAASI